MDDVDPAEHYVPRPGWRARIEARAPRRAQRILVLVAVLALHAGLFDLLQQAEWRAPVAPGGADEPLTLTWLPRTAPPPPSPRKSSETAAPRAPQRRFATTSTAASAPPDPPRPEAASAPPARPRLFGVDGALLLPDEVREDLESVGDPRTRFDYRMPGLIEARTAPSRPAALEYEATRFDEAWAEPKDLLTDALTRAVEKTTITVKIPLPRAPGSKAVCKVALLAAAGACGIRNESDGYVVRLDDPDTLDAGEDARCQGWWDAMVAATTETAWDAARRNYETHCRKPRAGGSR